MAIPTGSVFPSDLDNFTAVQAGDVALRPINAMRDAINKIEARVVLMQPVEILSADVSVGAGQRSVVTLTARQGFVGAESVLAAVTSDDANLSLIVDGLGTPTGTTVDVAILNRDPDAAHAGRVFVHVNRP